MCKWNHYTYVDCVACMESYVATDVYVRTYVCVLVPHSTRMCVCLCIPHSVYAENLEACTVRTRLYVELCVWLWYLHSYVRTCTVLVYTYTVHTVHTCMCTCFVRTCTLSSQYRYICTYMCVCICVYVYTYVCTYMYVYWCMYVRTYVHTPLIHKYVHTHLLSVQSTKFILKLRENHIGNLDKARKNAGLEELQSETIVS